VILFGNSLGGPVVIEAARLLEGRVLGVVGIDTFHDLGTAYEGEQARVRDAFLRQRGYEVTVFEASDRLGGLMTGTIPAYRLTDGVFEEDMARFRTLPVEFRFYVSFPDDLDVEDLLKEYDAVFIGLGTQKSKRLGIPGENLDGVLPALKYLKESKRGERVSVRPRVVVIGGGDVAMDSARSALRHGAEEVTVLYRRSREEMPADDQEIKEAMAEGVRFQLLVAPTRFLGLKRLEGVELQQMILGPPDESGRRKPVPTDTAPIMLRCDTAIVAVSQEADLEGVPLDLGLKVGKDGPLEADPATGRTNRPGVYAGGGASVAHAMAAGKRASVVMDESSSDGLAGWMRKCVTPGLRPAKRLL